MLFLGGTGLFAGRVPTEAQSERGAWEFRGCRTSQAGLRIQGCWARSAPFRLGARRFGAQRALRLEYGCASAGDGQWLYLVFSGSRDLPGGTPRTPSARSFEAWARRELRAEVPARLLHSEGEPYLYFEEVDAVVALILAAEQVTLRLPMFGDDLTQGRVDLDGSFTAISEARARCGDAPPPAGSSGPPA